MVEQTTESLPSDYRAIGSVTVGRLNQPPVKTLVRAFCVVMNHDLADEFSQVRLTQRDDTVQALLFDRADETLDEGVQIGTTSR